ncbi:MAG: hypothetical protein GF409_06135 [Candidatus Omnitrophica bacterium]|nr:hypothetical protein [Candidatus Omnitrophota bacterium]
MFGDRIIVKKDHETVARGLVDILMPEVRASPDRYIITVAGESGSGKSGIAREMFERLNSRGVKTLLIQQDDYFIYPPKTNEKFRREGTVEVGLMEVNLTLLQHHVRRLKDTEAVSFQKPLVMFCEDRIDSETVYCRGVKAVIIEGTYVSLLGGIDKKIFLAKTYKQTFFARLFRRRERIDAFTDRILSVEHGIISTHRRFADLVVEKNYAIVENLRKKEREVK